jgi:clan AA aspartic protease
VISGTVNSGLEAVVRLSIRGPQGEIETEAIVDTGFNGTLTLPPGLITKLNLRSTSRSEAVLADGSKVSIDLYEVLVLWNDRLLRIPVGAADSDPLLGMALLYGHEVAIRVLEGGEVFIQGLPIS